jgi:hypothetical protein
MRARRRLVERDKLLAGEKAEIGGGDPRPLRNGKPCAFWHCRQWQWEDRIKGPSNLEAHLAAQQLPRSAVTYAQLRRRELVFMLVCDLGSLGDASYPAIAAIGWSGIVWCVLAGDTRGVLRQVIGDREPTALFR